MKKIYLLITTLFTLTAMQAQVSFDEGDVVPDFTVTDLNGVEHTLYDYTAAGKWVLVDFFAYWCGPCAANAPTINEFYHKYGCNQGNVIVLAVEYEGTDEQTHEFEDWAEITNDNPYPSASGIDGGGAAVHAAYNASAFPTYIAISPENILLNHDIWPISGIATLEENFPTEALVEMECSVNVNEFAVAADFGIAPNPTENNSTITLSLSQNALIQLNITDALGRQVENINMGVLSTGVYQNVIHLENLLPGMYQVSLLSNGILVSSQHLVKQ